MPPGRDQADYISAIGTIRYILNKERNPFKFIDEPIVDTFRGGGASLSDGPAAPVREKRRSFSAWGHLKKFAERIKESFKELF
jgi:cell division protein FtsA